MLAFARMSVPRLNKSRIYYATNALSVDQVLLNSIGYLGQVWIGASRVYVVKPYRREILDW